jgi:hypothetical protein
MSVSSMELTETGFNLRFTKPLAQVASENFVFQRYYYKYHQSYGSPQLGKELVKVTALKLSKDGKSVSIALEKLNPGYVYQLDLKNITATDKTPALNTYICYTLNRLINGDDKAPHLTIGSTRKTKPAKAVAKVAQAKPMDFNQTEQIFEAEEGGRTGPSLATNNGGYTGKGFVDFQANSGEYLNWLIQTKKPGECALSFRYALADGRRPLQLKVNGKVIIKALPFVSTGSWTSWKSISTNALLKVGLNEIRLESTSTSGPNIDHLLIRRN